jgi:hypothetical protein
MTQYWAKSFRVGRACLLGADVEEQLAGIIVQERQEGNRVCGSQVQE